MKLQLSVVMVACLLSEGLSFPVFRPQIGILGSNSNELVQLNRLTLPGVGFGQAQGSPYMLTFGIQPDVGLPVQVVPLNPQLATSSQPQFPPMLLPAQGNQLPPGVFPPFQQEQPVSPQDPSIFTRSQIPSQVMPQYYSTVAFPQQPGGQRFSYYFPYGYPQRSPTMVQQQETQGYGQPTLEQTTQRPNLLLQPALQPPRQRVPGNSHKTEGITAAPSRRGDDVGTEEAHPNFSFVFEP